MAASSHSASGGGGIGCANADDSASSTPFVSAPSSPDRDLSFSAAGCFYSAPVSPAARGGHGIADEYGCELGMGFDFDFDFLRSPSPAAAPAMSSADELFHNGQIRPIKGGIFAINPPPKPPSEPAPPAGADDERGRLRSRSSVHRQYRSLSPFRTHWLSPSSSPAPAAKSVKKAARKAAPSSASRSSSSSSSTASSDSSSSSRSYRRWCFLKHIFSRSKSDGGERAPLLSSSSASAPAPAPKRSPSPSPAAASRGRGRPRRSAHVRLYEARRAEAEEMRRRTFLPYRKGLLLSFLGLGSRGYGDMHGLAAAGGKA